MVYIRLINFEANSYISRMTRNAKGARALIEAGFEYVCTVNIQISRSTRKSPKVC
jgi:hypothetical protein